jgi:hypothetical protein
MRRYCGMSREGSGKEPREHIESEESESGFRATLLCFLWLFRIARRWGHSSKTRECPLEAKLKT